MIDVKDPAHCGWHHFLGLEILDCANVERGPSTGTGSVIHCSLDITAECGCDVQISSSRPPVTSPNDGLEPGIVSCVNPFFLKLLFSQY